MTYDVKPVLDFIKDFGCLDEISIEKCTKALFT